MNPRHSLAALAVIAAFSSSAVSPALAATDEQKSVAYASVDRNAGAISVVGDSLYFFAEPGMQEVESARLLKDTLEKAGFRVRQGDAGFPTNIWAEWGSGKPKIAIVTEVDALPEGSQTPGSMPRKPLVAGAPGHMEGHNTHGAVAIAAAHALKQTMERYNLPGTVALSFGPAEEQVQLLVECEHHRGAGNPKHGLRRHRAASPTRPRRCAGLRRQPLH